MANKAKKTALNRPADAAAEVSAAQIGDQLDQVDRQLIELLARRCQLARAEFQAAGSGQPAGLMQAHGRRIDQLIASHRGGLAAGSDEELAAWLRHAASLSLAGLHRLRVAFLGPKYSYSHLAAMKYFGDSAPLAAVGSIPAVFDAIVRGDAEAGLVPIENSTDGRIVDTLGMFIRSPVKICGEVLLPIHHNLLGRSPREQVREVHSKPQALSQCRLWLANHLPSAKLVECASTTAAAELAAANPAVAAVASLEAARQYQLDVIDANIEDNPNNVTRFAVLGPVAAKPTGDDKTAILFQVAHRPGALADAMLLFKEAGLNLTWIESFPLPQSRAEYFFIVETVGHADDPGVRQTLAALAKITLRMDVIGAYPKSALGG